MVLVNDEQVRLGLYNAGGVGGDLPVFNGGTIMGLDLPVLDLLGFGGDLSSLGGGGLSIGSN